MRPIALLLASWTAGCQCHEYSIVPIGPRTQLEGEVREPGGGEPLATPRTAVPGRWWSGSFDAPAPGLPLRPSGGEPSTGDPEACDELASLRHDTAAPDGSDALRALPAGACTSDVTARWRDGSLVATVDGSAAGTLEVDRAGVYHLYAEALSPVAAGVVRVRSSDRPGGRPVHATCGLDWLVRADPTLPSGTLVHVGTFALGRGPNDLELRHACALPPDGACRRALEDDGIDCEAVDGAVRLRGGTLCLVAAE